MTHYASQTVGHAMHILEHSALTPAEMDRLARLIGRRIREEVEQNAERAS